MLTAFITSMLLATSAPPPFPVVDVAEARSIAAAILTHDRAIGELEWTQEVRTYPAYMKTPPGWVAFSTGSQGIDKHGRWYHERSLRMIDSDGTEAIDHGWWLFDSQRLYVRQVSGNGSIRPVGGFVEREPSILWLLGRCVDGEGHRRLGEVLLACPDLIATRDSVNQNTITLSGSTHVSYDKHSLVVTVDAERGFTPIHIVSTDANGRIDVDIMITRLEKKLDSWLPLEGAISCYSAGDAPDMHDWELHVARVVSKARAAGFDDALIKAIQTLTETRPMSAPPAGSVGVRSVVLRPLADGPMVVRVTAVSTLNASIDPEHFRIRFKSGARVLNAFDNDELVKNPESIRQWEPPSK